MDYLEEYQQSLRREIKTLQAKANDAIIENAQQIIDMNIEQIDNHIGSDGIMLKNTDRRFKGTYTQLTAEFALAGIPSYPQAPKLEGEPYNWVWEGDFVSGFTMEQKGDDFRLYSTGTGSGAKAKFFEGYRNLYGLTDENESIIFDEVKAFVMYKTLNNLWK